VGGGANDAAARPGVEGGAVRPDLRPAVVPRLVSALGHGVVPRIGLQFPARMPFQRWFGVGQQLSAVATSSAWCLGDWLAYGQDTYGSRYQKAVERTGLDYQTLRNYVWVARRFELSRRRETLSFGHHAEVASLAQPEQDFWLRKAEEFGWSTNQLRHQVRASLHERDGDRALEPTPGSSTGDSMPTDGPVTVRVQLSAELATLCEIAAGRQGLTIPAWAAQVLSHIAASSVDAPDSRLCPRPAFSRACSQPSKIVRQPLSRNFWLCKEPARCAT
jgi:hypothetical protein